MTAADPPGTVLGYARRLSALVAGASEGRLLAARLGTRARIRGVRGAQCLPRPDLPDRLPHHLKSRRRQAALDRGLADAAVLNRALDQQLGNMPPQAIGPAAAAFVRSVAASLRAAAAQPDIS
jgi:hypothetical protein